MEKSYLFLKTCLLALVISFITSCKGQSNSSVENDSAVNELPKKEDSQIGDYVVEIFEDSKGNIWFGTLEYGIARYDGKTLKYFTTKDGLPSNRVVNLIEDGVGNLWFGTGSGLSKYDGETFTNFSEKEGLCDNEISNLFIDSKGVFWIGSWGGVCKFDGNNFSRFPLPDLKMKTQINKDTKDWVTEIFEDSKGNIWFGRDGYGASKYDGTTFTHYSKEDGLASNNVQDIQEDEQGNVWFGSRVAEKDNPNPDERHGSGGLIKYDGESFINFPNLEGLNENDVYQIYRDSKENLWITTIGNGIYKYNGEDFTNYAIVNSVDGTSKTAMTFLEDSKGNIWIGCAGGLFRLNSGVAINITTNGPWN